MAMCVICGRIFPSTRAHAQTCSTKCRSALSRKRAKREAEAKKYQLTLEENSELNLLQNFSPLAAEKMRQLHTIHGREVYTLAIEAVREVYAECVRTSENVQ